MMKNVTKCPLFSAVACATALCTGGVAQAWETDLGGTGEDGALEILTDTTLAVPEDGLFQVTTLTVAAGATLSFTPNARNTPVAIVATGDIVIEGTIDMSGEPGVQGSGGAGGPGGGRGSQPVLRTDLPFRGIWPAATNTYNNLFMHGGRGGSGSRAGYDCIGGTPGSGGGGGGGGLTLISHTRVASAGGAGKIDLSGGTASAATTSCGGSSAGDGGDGYLSISAPTVDMVTFVVEAAGLYVNRLEAPNLPVGVLNGSNYSPSLTYSLPMVPAVLPTATITTVDGEAFEEGDQVTLDAGVNSVDVGVRVENCIKGTAVVIRSNDGGRVRYEYQVTFDGTNPVGGAPTTTHNLVREQLPLSSNEIYSFSARVLCESF